MAASKEKKQGPRRPHAERKAHGAGEAQQADRPTSKKRAEARVSHRVVEGVWAEGAEPDHGEVGGQQLQTEHGITNVKLLKKLLYPSLSSFLGFNG